MEKSTIYFPQLDSLRGLAALSVILWHYSRCVGYFDIYKPYLFFMYGTGAVIMFFVLSGFVLAASYSSNFGYLNYLFRRIFRIYPAYLVACLLSIISFCLIKPHAIAWLPAGFNLWSTAIITTPDILKVIILVDPYYFNKFVTPAWTLTIEMLVSVVFPLLLLMIKNRFSILVGFCYIFVCYFVNLKFSTNIIPAVYYSLFFVMGILIFKYYKQFNICGKIYFLPIYIFLYANPFFSAKLANVIYDSSLITGVGAVGIIIVAIKSDIFSNILKNNILSYIGKISYSIYLFHMPILLISVYSLEKYMNVSRVILLYFLTLPLTIIVAAIVHKYIELSFIKLGRNIFIKT